MCLVLSFSPTPRPLVSVYVFFYRLLPTTGHYCVRPTESSSRPLFLDSNSSPLLDPCRRLRSDSLASSLLIITFYAFISSALHFAFIPFSISHYYSPQCVPAAHARCCSHALSPWSIASLPPHRASSRRSPRHAQGTLPLYTPIPSPRSAQLQDPSASSHLFFHH